MKILAPTLWNAPYVHLQALEKIWVDNTTSIVSWRQFIQKLKDEWQEFTLYVRFPHISLHTYHVVIARQQSC